MMRLLCAVIFYIAAAAGVPAQAQDKVSFPSTDADLKDGRPTTITGYLYKPEGPGPFSAARYRLASGALPRERFSP